MLVHVHYAMSISLQIATLSRDEQPGSLVDRVFKLSLSEFHTSLISSYSLTLQVGTSSLQCHVIHVCAMEGVAKYIHCTSYQPIVLVVLLFLP